jgi:hypothetical protein
MAWLYDVELGRPDRPTKRIGCVRAISRPDASLVGNYVQDENRLVGPDLAEAFWYLPAAYRAAFKRNHTLWFVAGEPYAYVELWSANKRRFLGVVRFWLYRVRDYGVAA